MFPRSLAHLILIAPIVLACGKDKSSDGSPTSSQALTDASRAFATKVYQTADRHQSLRIISSTEIEFGDRDRNMVGTYSREGNKIRAVVEELGTKQSYYFIETPEGLEWEQHGTVYYNESALSRLEARAAEQRSAEEARQKSLQAEQDRIRQAEADEVQRRNEAYQRLAIPVRDGGVAMMKRFFTNGNVIQAYYDYRGEGAPTRFQITLTGPPSFSPVSDDPLSQSFEVPGHMVWLGNEKKGHPFVNSSHDHADNENDGVFRGSLNIERSGEQPKMNITVKWYVRDRAFQDAPWSARADPSVWNGSSFSEPTGYSYGHRYFKSGKS